MQEYLLVHNVKFIYEYILLHWIRLFTCCWIKCSNLHVC